MVSDCIDGSDEQDCTCKDYFEVFDPTRICDGYPDCYDFSDEIGCQRCPDNQFYCHLSGKCIPKSLVCDEKYDCNFQEDERYCVAMTNTDHVVTDTYGKPQWAHKGNIAINTNGLWRMVCIVYYSRRNLVMPLFVFS